MQTQLRYVSADRRVSADEMKTDTFLSAKSRRRRTSGYSLHSIAAPDLNVRVRYSFCSIPIRNSICAMCTATHRRVVVVVVACGVRRTVICEVLVFSSGVCVRHSHMTQQVEERSPAVFCVRFSVLLVLMLCRSVLYECGCFVQHRRVDIHYSHADACRARKRRVRVTINNSII